MRHAAAAVLLAAVSSAAAAQARPAIPDNGPFTDPPRLVNREEVHQAAVAAYPAELKAMGLGGTPTVRLWIDERGQVGARRVDRSSALPALDSAALAVSGAMRFEPARDGDRPVPLWITVPVTFRVEVSGAVEDLAAPARVTNPREVWNEMMRICGDRPTPADRPAMVAVFVAADGTRQAVELREPSGDPVLDAAVLLATIKARFQPARDAAGTPVASWAMLGLGPRLPPD